MFVKKVVTLASLIIPLQGTSSFCIFPSHKKVQVLRKKEIAKIGIQHKKKIVVPSSSLKAPLFSFPQDSDDSDESDESDGSINSSISISSSSDNDIIPSFINSVVLKQLYPALIKHIDEYGHPNIPLGTIDGKRCKTLRRLVFENKLKENETEFLREINFRVNSLEDVYEEADFDECLHRLIAYEKEYRTNYQIPKKFKPDPELGAWVTVIRRIGRDNIQPDRRQKLDDLNFAWRSTRKCGSSFMSNFRKIRDRLYECCCEIDEQSKERHIIDNKRWNAILSEEDVKKWVKAQSDAAVKGNLSDARCDYMDQLGFDWRNI